MDFKKFAALVRSGVVHAHHTSFARGYVKRTERVVTPYKGKFGEGFKFEQNCPFSTRYHYVTYFVK